MQNENQELYDMLSSLIKDIDAYDESREEWMKFENTLWKCVIIGVMLAIAAMLWAL